MEREKQIVKLIAQDIKHNQLTNGLEEIGLTDNETPLVLVLASPQKLALV